MISMLVFVEVLDTSLILLNLSTQPKSVYSRYVVLVFRYDANLNFGLLIFFYQRTHYMKPSVSQPAHKIGNIRFI